MHFPWRDFCFSADECGPGLYSPTGIAKCFRCPVGTYSSERRNKGCTNCPEGTFTVLDASAGIESCGSKYLNSGSANRLLTVQPS